MASYFREYRNTELSILFYLETCFNSDWSDITLVKTFKEVASTTNSLPIVCVRLSRTDTDRREIGSDEIYNLHTIALDVFARSDAQRLDLADYIKSKLKLGCVYYLHSQKSGTTTELDRVADGRLRVIDFLDDSRVDFGEAADEKEKYRHSIIIRVRKC